MSSKTYLGRQISSFEKSERFAPYSRVTIVVDDDNEYTAGDDTGRTLTLESPWGSQQTAEELLRQLTGYRYQPYDASGAFLDPAAELGDGVTVNQLYGGIYDLRAEFGPQYTADVAAHTDEELDHEYSFVPRQERKATRRHRQLRADLAIQADRITAEVSLRAEADAAIIEDYVGRFEVQADQISAKVSKTGGSPQSFGWRLSDHDWTLHANGLKVLEANIDGLMVEGDIRARTGQIGGFTLVGGALSTNGADWDHPVANSVVAGPQGIRCGTDFWVDSGGHIHAESGTFHGTVRAGSIEYGGQDGYFSGAGLSGRSVTGAEIAYNTVSTSHTSAGVNRSLGYANFSDDVFNNRSAASNIACQTATIIGRYLGIDGKVAQWKTATIGGVTITYLGR